MKQGKIKCNAGLVKISGENRRGGGGEGEDSQGLIKILTQLNWEENTGKWGQQGGRLEEEIYSVLSYARMKGVRGFVII